MREPAPGGSSIRLRSAWARVRTWNVERWLLVLLVLAPLIGLIGVVVAEIVPDGRIGYHLLRAEQAGLLGPAAAGRTPLDTRQDLYTECLMVSIGLGDPAGSNIISSALVSPSHIGCARLDEELTTLENTGRLDPGTKYHRYWHGYAVITRPAVGVFGLVGARWIVFSLLIGVLAGLAASVSRSFGWLTAVILLAPVVLTTDVAVATMSIAQAIGVASALAGGWLAFLACRRSPTWRTAGLAAALAGTVSVYFDVMTTLPGSLALAASAATLGVCAAPAPPTRSMWRVTLAGVIGWFVGLTWMWVSKWVLAAMVVGISEVVDAVRNQIEFRLSGEYRDVSPSRTAGLEKNFSEWWNKPLTPWVIVLTVMLVVAVVGRTWFRRRNVEGWRDTALCVLIVAVPFMAWFMALDNHTQIHAWLVYRSLPIAFGAVGAMVVGMTSLDWSDRAPQPSAERLPTNAAIDVGVGTVDAVEPRAIRASSIASWRGQLRPVRLCRCP